jgi:hypothetical protein
VKTKKTLPAAFSLEQKGGSMNRRSTECATNVHDSTQLPIISSSSAQIINSCEDNFKMSNFEPNERNLVNRPLKLQFERKCHDDNFTSNLLGEAAKNVKLKLNSEFLKADDFKNSESEKIFRPSYGLSDWERRQICSFKKAARKFSVNEMTIETL